MRAVGIRELKNRLSHYVRLVEAGESVLVTDRGSVVAELRPPGSGAAPVLDPVGRSSQRWSVAAERSEERRTNPSSTDPEHA